MKITPLTSGKQIPFLGKNKEVKDVIVIKTTDKNPIMCQPLKPNEITRFNKTDDNGKVVATGTKVVLTKYDEEGNISSTVEATKIDYLA